MLICKIVVLLSALRIIVMEENLVWFLKPNDEVNVLAWFCVFH